ncbi:MAG: carboxylating nicotinate-nucleotide diphosphorylase, partial [Oscillospiraceae bacterium]
MVLNKFYVDDLIKDALKEDINYVDVTTDYLIDEEKISVAKVVSKDEGILSGIDIFFRVFTLLDDEVKIKCDYKDGDKIQKGDVIATLNGKTRTLLKGERTALNILQHLCGIATLTNRCVQLTKGTNTAIVDTRKTLPLLRCLQKYAVTCGGGKNHRYNLSDGAMIKDNHIDAYGSITGAVNALREKAGHMIKIEVETRNLEEVKEALQCRADVIMLDNMDTAMMSQAVKLVDGKAVLEASGNITDQRIKEICQCGVDIISMGALTHSVKAFD